VQQQNTSRRMCCFFADSRRTGEQGWRRGRWGSHGGGNEVDCLLEWHHVFW